MTDKKYLLPPLERYFKANLHAHSNLSDGFLSPQELKDAYKAKGYSILSITDHNLAVDHSAMNEEGFLLLTGAEYDISEEGKLPRHNSRYTKTYHINCIAKRPDLLWQPFANEQYREELLPYLEKAEVKNMPRVYDVEAINAIIARANEKGYLVAYNHPNWSLQDYTDYAGLKGLWGMEISNYGSTMMGYCDSDNSMVYRDLMNLTGGIFPLSTDDCHRPRDVGGGWIMVGAEKLEYGSVIRALEKGDFYASTGPEIHSLTMEGPILRITCSDAQQITAVCSNRHARKATPIHNDGLLREAEFDLTAWFDICQVMPHNWLRIVVQGPYGHTATTRAYTPDELCAQSGSL